MTQLLFTLFLLLPLSFLCADPQELSVISQDLVKGTVPTLTTKELADILQKKEVLLLDTREEREFEISHLPNARWVGYDDFKIARLAKVDKHTPIVVYCSVGYRSEKIGETLKQAGYTNVTNLSGGLFTWANEQRPLKDKAEQTTLSVHGYDATWSQYLSPRITTVLE